MQRLALLVLIACAAAQPAIGSPLAANALTLGIHANLHTHGIEVRSDGGHVDIVLSHAGADGHDNERSPQDHEHAEDITERDHVLHVTAGDVTSATPRRMLHGHAPVLAVSSVLPPKPARAAAPVRSNGAPARGADHLRTVVLRL